MRPWLLTAALAVFIVGGFAGGAIGIRNLSTLSRPGRSVPNPVAASATAMPRQVATPELAPHPPLRDFDQNPPPFEPAAAADVCHSSSGSQTPAPDTADTRERTSEHPAAGHRSASGRGDAER